MTIYYVDSNTGSNSDTGLTQALAWDDIEHAVEAGSLVAGDEVWVRRTHLEPAISTHLYPGYDGSYAAPIILTGWPRPSIPDTTITQASWTNGSTTVSGIVGITADREKHMGRWATAPNGSKFLITRIISTSSVVIDREYSGATVSTTSGKFSIDEDENYTDRPTDVDGWDSDAHDLPRINFPIGSAYWYHTRDSWVFRNLDFYSAATSTALLSVSTSSENIKIVGCLFHATTAKTLGIIYCAGRVSLDRVIITGDGTNDQTGYRTSRPAVLKNIAIYNLGGASYHGLYSSSEARIFMDNVNVGVEQSNAGPGLRVLNPDVGCYGKDVKISNTTQIVVSTYNPANYEKAVAIENWGKQLGSHLFIMGNTQCVSLDVFAGSGDPYKRTGGGDKIMDISFLNSSLLDVLLFEHEFEATTDSKSYTYYMQCKDMTTTSSELYIEVDYVDSYDDASEYTMKKVRSTQSLSLRTGVSDWTRLLSVAAIAPAVASKVWVRCFMRKYDADGHLFIDPCVVIG